MATHYFSYTWTSSRKEDGRSDNRKAGGCLWDWFFQTKEQEGKPASLYRPRIAISRRAARWAIKFFKGTNINSLNKYFFNIYVPDTKLNAGETEMTGFLY